MRWKTMEVDGLGRDGRAVRVGESDKFSPQENRQSAEAGLCYTHKNLKAGPHWSTGGPGLLKIGVFPILKPGKIGVFFGNADFKEACV